MRPGPQRSAVFYDGDCGFCRACAEALVRLDRGHRLAVAPFSDPEAAPAEGAIPSARRGSAIFLVSARREAFGGGDALLAIMRTLPPLRPLAAAIEVLNLVPLLRIAYLTIARRRDFLGRILTSDRRARSYP